MSVLTEPLRARLQETLSGQRTGAPDWIAAFEGGDDAGFFGPGSAVWAVHGGIPTLVAGIRALLMQSLHPGALAGVHDWSDYQKDPLARLAGTIRWIFTVSYGDTAQSVAGSDWVKRLHGRIVGNYIDGHGR
ncbi:MAG: oxygenase MpaB family protein, partial [Microbacteriaceae bacterium]